MFKRNGNRIIKKLEGEARYTSHGFGIDSFSLPLFQTSMKGKLLIKYKITVEMLNGDKHEGAEST